MKFLPIALLASIAFVPDAGARYEKCLPVETYAVVQQPDFPAFLKRLEMHPLAADLKKAGLNKYFEPMLKLAEEEFVKEGHTAKDFANLLDFLPANLNGEVLLAAVQGHFILIADLAADEKTLVELCKKYSHKNDVNNKWVVSTFQGVTLHEFHEHKRNVGGWALVGRTLVIGSSPEVLRETVDALQNGRKDNFSGAMAWKRAQSAAGDADLIFTFNVPLYAEEMRKFALELKNKKDPLPSPLGVVPFKLYENCGIGNVSALWSIFKVTPADVRLRSSLEYTKKGGLLSLLTFTLLDPVLPAYMPEVKSFEAVGWDMRQALKNFEPLFAEAIPPLKSLIDAQLAKLKSEHGMDLRAAVLENLGQNFATISGTEKLPASLIGQGIELAQELLFIADVRDEAKLVTFIEGLWSKFGPNGGAVAIEEVDYMGIKIRSLGEDFAYSIHDGKIFLACDGTEILKKTIAEIKAPQKPDAKNLAVCRALKHFSDDIFLFTYNDVSDALSECLPWLERLFRNGQETIVLKLLDETERPLPAPIPWATTTAGHERVDGICIETILFRNEAQ